MSDERVDQARIPLVDGFAGHLPGHGCEIDEPEIARGARHHVAHLSVGGCSHWCAPAVDDPTQGRTPSACAATERPIDARSDPVTQDVTAESPEPIAVFRCSARVVECGALPHESGDQLYERDPVPLPERRAEGLTVIRQHDEVVAA